MTLLTVTTQPKKYLEFDKHKTKQSEKTLTTYLLQHSLNKTRVKYFTLIHKEKSKEF